MTALLLCALPVPLAAADAGNPYGDPPPLRATSGIADCPAPVPRVLTPDEARREAHQRIERGTSCWLAGQCEAGGDYKDDAAVNVAVARAIAADPRFANSSVWVETLRKFVTVSGCIADEGQGSSLEALVRSVRGVKLVWQEARVRPRTPPPAAPLQPGSPAATGSSRPRAP